MSQSNLDDARSALEQALNRQQAAQGQLVISRAKVAEAVANVAQASAAVENAEEDLANATIKDNDVLCILRISPRCEWCYLFITRIIII